MSSSRHELPLSPELRHVPKMHKNAPGSEKAATWSPIAPKIVSKWTPKPPKIHLGTDFYENMKKLNFCCYLQDFWNVFKKNFENSIKSIVIYNEFATREEHKNAKTGSRYVIYNVFGTACF